MEETQIETAKPSQTLISFPPHRRRHLRSETYHTLVRILSHCYNESQHSIPSQFVPQELNQDTGSNESGQATEKEVYENVELVAPESVKPDNSAAQRVSTVDESSDANVFRETIEQIEDLMISEENEYLSKQKDAMDIENIFGIGFQDLGFGPEQMLMDELEQIVNENEDSTPKPSTTSLDQNPSGNDKFELLNNQERDDFQHGVALRSDNVDQKVCDAFDSSLTNAVVGEISNQKESNEHNDSLRTNTLVVEPIMQHKGMETSVSAGGDTKAFDFSLNKDMVVEASKPSECNKDKSYTHKTNYLEVEHEMQPKDKELEKIACTRNGMTSPNHMNDRDIEEGEISGDDGTDDRSIDMILHDTVMFEEKKVNEVQICKDVIGRKEHPCKEANGIYFDYDSFLVDTADKVKNGGGVELRESKRTESICRPGVVEGKYMKAIKADDFDPLVESGRIEKKNSQVREVIGCPAFCTSNLPLHEQISVKNTAGTHGITSEEKWDAIACNKKKRGLPSKESKERKKAKDRKKRAEKNRKLGVKRLKLLPIQKPKTVNYCRHYLKGRCYEGEKCKFSHDMVPLTKSKPCSFFARGLCMKGDDCPYDHQLIKYPCDKFIANGFCSRGDQCLYSHKMTSKEDSATAACKPELTPSLVQGNSGSAQVKIGSASHKNAHTLSNTELNAARALLKQPVLATKGICFFSTGKPSLVQSSMYKQGALTLDGNTGTKAGNLIDQSPSSSFQNSNDILMRTPPVVTPKGINFLSFGKASPDDASGTNQVCHQTSPSVPETVQNSNGMLQVNQPAAAPQGLNFFSFGETSVANSSSGKPVSLASGCGNNGNQTRQSVSGTVQNSNGMLKVNQPAAAPQELNCPSFGKASIANSSSEKPVSLASGCGNNGDLTSPSVSRTVQNSIGVLKVNQPAAAPQGLNFFSLGKSSVANSSNEKPVSLAAGCGNNMGFHENQNRVDNPQNSSAISLKLPHSPLTSDQSSDHIASRFHKDTDKSSQRAFFSTLAFAAKYETKRMNQSIGSTSTLVDRDTKNSSMSEGLQNDTAKALKILDFLSGIGSKTKQ